MFAALFVVVGGCSTTTNGHAETACDPQCTGTLDGAPYDIRVPANWTGTLLIYSQGYSSPAAYSAVARVSPSDATGRANDVGTDVLLRLGYAVAGVAYRAGGWVTADAVQNLARLYKLFVQRRGTPRRTILWGISFGGLVTEVAAEQYHWVDGAMPMCGAVAGPLLNFDNFLEGAFAVKVLLDPTLQITGFATRHQADAAADRASADIQTAAEDVNGGGAAKAVFIADLLGTPTKIAGHASGSSTDAFVSLVRGAAEYVQFGLSLRYDLERRYGGNPSQTLTSPIPVTTEEQRQVAAVHGDAAGLARQLDAARPVRAQPTSRSALAVSGDPTGAIRVPTLAIHDEFDPIVLAANEAILRSRAAAAARTDQLMQLIVSPPPGVESPAYGVGHCVFSAPQILGSLALLDTWVRTGVKPSVAASEATAPGLAPAQQLPAWPSGAQH